jgi:hypothetical protein
MTGRIDLRPLACSLQDAQLCLELDDVAPEGLERVLDALLVVPVRADREIFNPR